MTEKNKRNEHRMAATDVGAWFRPQQSFTPMANVQDVAASVPKTIVGRRTVLRALGATLALPCLESLAWAEGDSATADGSPKRMVFCFVPNGIHMPDWTPENEGRLKRLPKTLEPLARHRDALTVLSGLALDGGRSHGDGPGDHARCVASFLTAAHPYKTDGKDIRNGVSVDQVAAQHIGRLTPLPSLELGTEPSAQAGRCDSGYSCIYTSNISWRTPTSPMTKEIDPRAVFDRVFGGGRNEKERAANAARWQRRRSVLDFLAEDAQTIRHRLSGADRQKLDEYLYAVRQIEQRISKSEKIRGLEENETHAPRPDGIPREYAEHVELMLDMIVLALRCDATRTVSFMFTNAGSNRNYPEIDVRRGHHQISHHGRDKGKQADIAKINRFHVGMLSHLLDAMRDVPQDEGTNLLDHSMVMYGSGLADGDRHEHHDLPIVLAGRGGGTIEGGRHVAYPKDTPLANLYLAMLRRSGVDVKSFGDSTSELEGLG